MISHCVSVCCDFRQEYSLNEFRTYEHMLIFNGSLRIDDILLFIRTLY
jgi:hypothetical protein